MGRQTKIFITLPFARHDDDDDNDDYTDSSKSPKLTWLKKNRKKDRKKKPVRPIAGNGTVHRYTFTQLLWYL